MKENIIKSLFALMLFFTTHAMANCSNVYTIGAYEEAFANHAIVTKLGPLAASDVPPSFPKSFLEKDGSYGGGEAFCSMPQTCRAIMRQLQSGILPSTETWYVYLLDAKWNQDVYELHPDDFRIHHTVQVLKRVSRCDK